MSLQDKDCLWFSFLFCLVFLHPFSGPSSVSVSTCRVPQQQVFILEFILFYYFNALVDYKSIPKATLMKQKQLSDMNLKARYYSSIYNILHACFRRAWGRYVCFNFLPLLPQLHCHLLCLHTDSFITSTPPTPIQNHFGLSGVPRTFISKSFPFLPPCPIFFQVRGGRSFIIPIVRCIPQAISGTPRLPKYAE